jgi:DnaJ-class molecular chaperone
VCLVESKEPSKTGIWRDPTNHQDLRAKVSLTLAEALCGWTRVITHLDGRIVEVSCGEVRPPGSSILVSNEGMKQDNGSTGDLSVEVDVTFPESVGDKRALWGLLSRTPYKEHITPDHIRVV